MSVDVEAPRRRDRSHFLYLSVLLAMVLGIALGFLLPDVAVKLKPLGTGFVALIRMMIAPVIFCTLVLGVGSIRRAAQVGRVGGLALGYFLVMSTVALAIGLVVGNILHPGAGLHLSQEAAQTGSAQVSKEAEGGVDFVLGIIPDTLVSALTSTQVLQTLLVALLVGFAVQSLGERGEPVIRAV